MDLHAAAELLRAKGWEVTQGEGEIVASREDQEGAWTLAVDGRGWILFTATRPLRPARARRVVYAGRAYRTLWEEQGVFSLRTEVHSPEELAQVLDHLHPLLHQALSQTRHAQ